MSTDDLKLTYLSGITDILNLEKIVLLAIGIIVLFIFSKLLKILSNYLCLRLPSKRIIIYQVTTVLNFFLHLAGSFYIIYGILKPPQELMLALLGSTTFAVGFALKDLAASLISGITLVLAPPFQVGDRIRFRDIYGEVKYVGLRTVRIQTQDFRQVTIPNSIFMSEAVTCANKGKLNLNVVTVFNVSLSSDIERVKETLREVVATSKYAYLEEPVIIFVNRAWNADLISFEITVQAHTIDAKYEPAFQSDIYSRGVAALRERGIAFPSNTPLQAGVPHINALQSSKQAYSDPQKLSA